MNKNLLIVSLQYLQWFRIAFELLTTVQARIDQKITTFCKLQRRPTANFDPTLTVNVLCVVLRLNMEELTSVLGNYEIFS